MRRFKIFITGSSGFIARNIIEQLGEKYQIIAPNHLELNLLDSDSMDQFFKIHKNFDFVIHTAIVGGNRKIGDRADLSLDNLHMFFNIVRNKRYFGKMVNLGSGTEYGKERPLKKVAESDFDTYIPQDNFGLYKYVCAKFIESSDGILNLRLFGVFGKYEDFRVRFISNAICKSILKMPITINQNVYFDYLYIDDFVKILDYFLTKKNNYKSYNVGTGERISLVSIANKINRLANFKVPIKIKHPGLNLEYSCNNKRLVEELGDFKFTRIDSSINTLYSWYVTQMSNLRREDFTNDYFD